MDYEKLGLMVGIEIHQELATEHKLFCNCPPMLSKEGYDFTFTRKLRPAQSELGEIDPAALFEFLKGKTIIYEADHETSCLVEMDEEPPGPMDREALDIAMTFSLMTKGSLIDEVQVMRKTVVDGSNTGGFQRTSVVSLGGEIRVDGEVIHLEQVAVEEDAARKTSEDGNTITYRLDRLGIPLIEVTTAPEMYTPDAVYSVAKRIGSILRATGKVRRGLGTIRQDVNVSIKNGAINEIKGAQDLGMLSTLVEYEAMRQGVLLEIRDELDSRKVKEESLVKDFIDVSDLFKSTKSKILLSALKRGGRVYAVKLPGFNGVLGKELCPNRRLGTEMSDHAKFMGGVKGIFHTDELPGYSITGESVLKLRARVKAEKEDAVVIVADEKSQCKAALTAVIDRAVLALKGVPAETRSANPDGTTRFTRPRPGAARMYPETDVKPIRITSEKISVIRSNLPDMPEVKLEKYMKTYGLNEKLAVQVIDSDYVHLFQELAEMGLSPTLLAVTLTEDLTKIRRDGVPVDDLTPQSIKDTFNLVKSGTIVKESVVDMLTYLARNPDHDAERGIIELGLEMMTDGEVKQLVESIVADKLDLVEEQGMRAMGPLMGLIMSKAKGKASPKHINQLLDSTIRALIE